MLGVIGDDGGDDVTEVGRARDRGAGDRARIRALLDEVAAGRTSAADALEQLKGLPFADLDDLRIDHHRTLRTGTPELVYGEGKTPDQCARAVAELLAHGDGPVIATRLDPAGVAAVREVAPGAEYDELARLVVARRADLVAGRVAVACAGTADLPVAREATTVLDAFGAEVELVADVGVAGAHRLLAVRDRLAAADVVVAVAGMEGAMPTLIGGLVDAPVVAVPTSVGYGASFDGIAALLGMLTSCAPGVAVVNIDGGVSAALVAVRILQRVDRAAAGAPDATGSER